MLKLVGVTKTYHHTHTKAVVLSNIDVDLERGQIAVLVGHSGSGKTTLLNIVGCLVRPTTGSVFLDDEEVSALPDHFLSDVRRYRIGFVFQQYNLLPGYTAAENVALPLVPMGIGEAARMERAMHLLEQMDMSARAGYPVERLSGGEQQRVAVARALINNPALVLADEPTSNVDPETELLIRSLFTRLADQGTAIIVASHNEAWQKPGVGDVLWRIENGEVSIRRPEEVVEAGQAY